MFIAAFIAQAMLGSSVEARVPERQKVDLLIVGGTESGWAAAIQAARMGIPHITIVHDGHWLGGQFTEQALACVDENKGVGKVGFGVPWHPMKRSFHRSGLFKELMDQIETHNLQKYGDRMPGRPYHGPSTFRPAEAEAIFRKMITPYVETGQIELIFGFYPDSAELSDDGTALRGLRFQSTNGDDSFSISARLTIDASDWGEAIQAAGAAFDCGPDPYERYKEPSAPRDLTAYPPNEMNPITWAMIVEKSERSEPIPRPANFDDRNYIRTSKLSLAGLGPLRWDRPAKLSSILHWPAAGQASPRQLSVYNVRRLIDGYTSHEGKTVILLNYMLGQDYPLERLPQRVIDALEATEPGASKKNIVKMTRQQREIVFEDARQHSLGVLYHLQTYVHDRADDKSHSFRRFQLSDEFGTVDRLPPKPYIRESLRLRAMYMMREQDGRNTDGPTKTSARESYASVMYPDAVAAWQFHYDFHRTGRAYLESEGNKGPWIDFEKPGRHTHFLSDRSVFPLRSLIPESVDGLIGAQKNVGYSSIVSAAIRLHDQCIHIGQAAGALAATCLDADVAPRDVPFNRELLRQLQASLCRRHDDGQPMLLWPYRDLHSDHPDFEAINLLSVRGIIPLNRRQVDFQPDQDAAMSWRLEIAERTSDRLPLKRTLAVPRQKMSRGQFATLWWKQIKDLPDLPFVRQSPDDADGDGIKDRNDPLPFDSRNGTLPEPVRPPDTDGLPDATGVKDAPVDSESWFVDFGGRSKQASKRLIDFGNRFEEQRGYGWKREIRNNIRRRQIFDESCRDTFVFTRTGDTWELAVPDGRYRVTICVGDAGHTQPGQTVSIERQALIEAEDTAPGWFLERTREVVISDGRLTVELGPQKPGTNSCLNWLQVQRVH